MVGFDIQMGSSIIVLTLKKKRDVSWTPFPLLCAAFLIRNGLSYATMHNVSCQAVQNTEGKMVAYVIYVTDGFEQSASGEYGSCEYLRSIGFGETYLDFREDVFRQRIINSPGYGSALVKEVEGWQYRTIPHKNARSS